MSVPVNVWYKMVLISSSLCLLIKRAQTLSLTKSPLVNDPSMAV